MASEYDEEEDWRITCPNCGSTEYEWVYYDKDCQEALCCSDCTIQMSDLRYWELKHNGC